MLSSRLGEILVREGLATEDQVREILAESKQGAPSRLVENLVSRGIVDEQTLIKFLATQYRMTVMDLSDFEMPLELQRILPSVICVRYGIVPVSRRQDTLVIAVSDPTNIQALDEVRFQTRLRVEQVLALPSVIRTLSERYFGTDVHKIAEEMNTNPGTGIGEIEVADAGRDVENNQGEKDDAPIIALATAILTDAIRKKASDIHIEPFEKEVRIRIRIDGELEEAGKLPLTAKSALNARIKLMARLRLDEKRLPQDGRVRFRLPEGKTVDFRVNTLPTVFGEKIVLRVLDPNAVFLSMSELGFEREEYERFKKAIHMPWGMCLVTGPTGSGKTTTLYSGIGELNKLNVNISTLEDPVEYNFRGINQTNIRENIGLTFSETLRAILRQDPDIILVGEIRDSDTLQTALKAAITGHMVLSTIHTNDAPSTIFRLKDMGADLYLINSALELVVAQRLVRTICEECKAPVRDVSQKQLLSLGFPKTVLDKFQPMRGQGCRKCHNSGFKGRAAVYEVMPMTESIREFVGRNASYQEIRKLAIAEGMSTLRANGMRKVMRGETTLEELQALGGANWSGAG